MKKYPKYKPSGVEWLGEIPQNWDVVKLKFTGENLIGLTYSPNDIVDMSNGILVLRSSNIQNGKVAYDDCVYLNMKIPTKLITRKGDILLCARNGSVELVGKNICIDETTEGLTFGAFMTIYRSKYWQFFSYFFNSEIFKAQSGLFSTSTINQLTNDTLRNMKIALPQFIEEQQTIVQFLDYKTVQIDSFIDNRRKQIELLKEEKAGIINKAVTKGINPNAKMKPSGIEWLPEVPATWEVWRMKFLSKIGTGNKNTEDAEDDGAYPFYVRSDNVERISSYSFEGEAILTAGDGVGVAKVYHYATGKMAIHQRVYKISHFKRVLGEFLYFYIKDNFEKEVIKLSAKTTVDSLRMHMLGNFPVAHPSKNEQEEILKFIKSETSTIDTLITKYQNQIDLMQEYRTSLISQAVTGKIDVRDWKPKVKEYSMNVPETLMAAESNMQ